MVYGADNQPEIRPQNQFQTRPEAQFNSRERFSSLLFQPISRDNLQKNVVYSPASVHTMLALLSTVSSGETALELQRVAQLSADKMAVARDFKRQLNAQQKLENAQLIVANKLYYNYQLAEINPDYKRFAQTYFESDIEAIDVNRPANSASRINAWAADATRNRIRNLVSPGDIDTQTQALLVNAIYFKARWNTEFSVVDTTTDKFQLGRGASIKVPMMFNDDIFDYADLPELDAKAVELPYAGTEASMLIILPNQIDGLAQLESQLARQDLNYIAARLRREMVTLRLPKFRIEFDQDISGPLQQLGLRRMFTDQSEVDTMLLKNVKVSKMLQKAFLDVNEAGSEAAAATCEYPHLLCSSCALTNRAILLQMPSLCPSRCLRDRCRSMPIIPSSSPYAPRRRCSLSVMWCSPASNNRPDCPSSLSSSLALRRTVLINVLIHICNLFIIIHLKFSNKTQSPTVFH